ncbi:hypothetical protein [Angustibacter luteus]|uniref:Uncharacterized protein n=1 Tax=Angustibacter luteus TaxID=658456 RepID=A0ABW1J9T7_9ACTN
MNLRKKSPADGVVDESAPGGRKGLVVAAGVAAGLAVVVGMGYVLVSGGDDAPESGVVASANHTPAAKATAAPTKAAKAKAAPAIKKYTSKTARDPFKALVVEPVASTGGAAGTSATGGATAPATQPTAAPSGATTITLVSVTSTNSSANFKVNSAAANGIKKGQTFGEHFKLIDMSGGKCATVQFGDISVNMCEGKSLSVS